MNQASKEDYDFIVKIILIGDAKVGKTALMRRFCDDYLQSTNSQLVNYLRKYIVVTSS